MLLACWRITLSATATISNVASSTVQPHVAIFREWMFLIKLQRPGKYNDSGGNIFCQRIKLAVRYDSVNPTLLIPK
jgi:hypothetical protein